LKPNKHAIVRSIVLVTFAVLILCVYSPITIYDGTQVDTKGSANLIEEDTTNIEPEPVSSPNGDAIPAEATWNLAAANMLVSAPWGSTRS
jgi:hypothetical protein